MKSREVRDNWREVIRHVENGGTVIVEHYNRPVARIVPIEEPAMQKKHIAPTDIRVGDKLWDGGTYGPVTVLEEPEPYTDSEGKPCVQVRVRAEKYGRDVWLPFARDTGVAYLIDRAQPVVWSVVRGESPTSRAVEPGPAGVTIPRDVIDWAESHGLADTDPDVYLLVTPEDEAGEVPGEIAYRKGTLPAKDVAAIRQALDALTAERAERNA